MIAHQRSLFLRKDMVRDPRPIRAAATLCKGI